MNTFFNNLGALLMTILSLLPWNLFNSKNNARDFRVVSYAVASNFMNQETIDNSHFSQITDVIFFGVANFDENGNVILADNFDKALNNLKMAIGENDVRIHLNLLGPGGDCEKHSKAFQSGILENEIITVLEKYQFDGVFFDYEYPATKDDWNNFDNFLISLDKLLGDKYILGCAISAWNTKQSRKAINVLDMVEVMAYDFFDDDGTHSSISLTKCCVLEMLMRGYKKEQMDLGLPFYGRPVNQGAYWYGYGPYTKTIDDKGFVYIEETGLTFSFNTYNTIYDKTEWAIRFGLGGTMVWHYSCDAPSSDPLSLFNAIHNAKNNMS